MPPKKVKNSGKTERFEFSTGGKWHMESIHGWLIWLPSKGQYVRFSPRDVALALALRQFWIANRGAQFPWRDTIGNLRYYVRRTGHVNKDDYSRAKVIIRELGPFYMDPNGDRFVYASTRGSHAVSGFVTEAVDAETYERKNHEMLRTMEGRIANGTVDPAGVEFGVPVKPGRIKTKTL